MKEKIQKNLSLEAETVERLDALTAAAAQRLRRRVHPAELTEVALAWLFTQPEPEIMRKLTEYWMRTAQVGTAADAVNHHQSAAAGRGCRPRIISRARSMMH